MLVVLVMMGLAQVVEAGLAQALVQELEREAAQGLGLEQALALEQVVVLEEPEQAQEMEQAQEPVLVMEQEMAPEPETGRLKGIPATSITSRARASTGL